MPSLPSRLAVLLATFVALAWTAPARADWPQWGGTHERNMISAEANLPETFEPGEKLPSGGGIDPETTRNVRWAAKLGSQTYGNPTVAGGRVFVGTDDFMLSEHDSRFTRTKGGVTQCLDDATGELLWQLVVPKRTKLPPDAHFGHQHLGVCSSPTVEGDRVYVITSAGEVACLDVDGLADGNDGPFVDEAQYMVGDGGKPVELADTDADIVWLFDTIGQCGVVPHDAASCSVLIHGDFLYTSTSNGVDGPHAKVVNPDAPAIIVLQKKTGRLVATDGEEISTRLWHAQWSSPSLGRVGGRTLIFFGGGDGYCYAFEALAKMPDGDLPVELATVWKYDANPPHYRLRDGKPIPYYDGDKRKRRGNNNDGKYLGPSQIIATPVFHKDRIYVAIGQDPAHGRGRGMLHCIDATKTGEVTESGKVWSYDGIERTMSTVAVADGLVYCPGIAGRLHCVDAETGEVYWTHDTDAETWASPLVADGKVYLGTQKHFWVFAAGKEAKVLSQIRLGAPAYCSTIADRGTLYVASQRYLWAVAATGQ
jgi:outer membrane protein assembly factor BamB